MGNAHGVVGVGKAVGGRLGGQLGPDPGRSAGIANSDRPSATSLRAGREQLERVAPGATPPMPTIGSRSRGAQA